MDSVRHAPLEDRHLALGAKMAPFGGWEMPIAYPSGTIAEHRACRTDAVVFDVSHLGTVRLTGPEAFDVLQRTLTNDLTRIQPGRAQYTHLLNDRGGVVDDIIVWWVDEERFDVMPNASNTDDARAAFGGIDVTASRVVLAIQGPLARTKLSAIAPELASVPRFCVRESTWAGSTVTVAGTGYTGEDGVEVALPLEAAHSFFDALLDSGITPAGLGARDTLRLEAGLPLHGHELSATITPLEAKLNWVLGWNKGDFVGRAALEAQRDRGVERVLVGIVTEGRQPPRDGAEVLRDGAAVGTVTSGNFSPMLERGIAMAFLERAAGVQTGDAVEVVVRGKALVGTVVPLPFWPPRES